MIPLGRRNLSPAALLLSLLLLWVPLPFASVNPSGVLILRLAAFLAVTVAVLDAGALDALLRASRPVIALLAVALLGLLQALPWPAALAGAVSPGHLALQHQAWQAMGEAPRSPWLRLTLAPEATLSASLTWAAVAAVFATALIVGRRDRSRRLLGAALLLGGALQLLAGGVRAAADSRVTRALALPETTERLQGTFANANHLALYLEILLAVTFSWAAWAWTTTGAPGRRPVVRRAAPLLAWSALFAGLAFTGSRAGLAAALASVTCQALVLARRRGRRLLVLAAPVAVALGLAAVVLIDARLGLGRLVSRSLLEDLEARAGVSALTFELWQRFPWTGVGLAAFGEAFPMVQPSVLARAAWSRAHNDLLELLAGGGLIAALLLVAGLLGLVPFLRRALPVESGERQAAALAALGALVAAGVHELFDFGLTIPANGVTLAAVVGAAVGAGIRSPADPSTD